MFLKTSLLFLGALLLLHSCNAAPYKDLDSALKALVDRLKLMQFASSERSVFEKDILQDGIAVMEKVIVDPKVLEVKSDKINSILDDMRSTIEKYKKFEKTGKTHGKEFGQLLDKIYMFQDMYVDESRVPSTQEGKALARSFQENGYKKIDYANDPRVKTYTDNFYAEVEKYVNGLSEDEKKNCKDLIKFLKEFKDETDIEKRDNLIMGAVFVKLDDFLW